MGFGAGNLPSGLLDYMANAPNLAGRSEFDRPAREPLVIEPQDDSAPTTRPRRAGPQLDASNLAGPVPTNLAGDQQFDPMTILSRRVTDSGQPQTDTSPSPIVPGGGPQISNAESGPVMGLAGSSTRPPDLPPIHLHSIGRTDTGDTQPLRDSYNNSVDSSGNHIGKMSRFGHSFLAAGGMSNPIQGAIAGILGLAVPSLGNRAAFNMDNARFHNEQRQELQTEDANRGYQNRLEVEKRHQELPDEIARYQAQQQAMTGRQLAVGEQRDENRQTLQDQKDAAAMERLGATWDAKSKAKLNERFADLRAESVNSGLTDDQVRDKAAQGIALEQKAALAKTNAQTARYEELTKSTGERLKQGEQRLKIMQQNANTNAGRLAQGQSNAARVANNQAVNNQLKSLTSYVGSLKTQYTAHSKTLNDPYSSPEAKEAAEREMGRINKELDDVDTQQRGLTGAPARGAKGAPAAGGTHPNVGKTFTKDGKQYVADEIDSAGNITKYHEK